GTYGLPDPGDEHVLAAAAFSGASAIITNNLKHFPPHLLPNRLEALPSADFARYTAELDPARAIRAVEQISRRRRTPPLQPAAILETLGRLYGMSATVEVLIPYLEP
ncbi:MAG: PIN domain-containing protein, partial [Phycicoccus sp.]